MNKTLVAGALALSFVACSKEAAATPGTPPAAGAPAANQATASFDFGKDI